MKIPQAKYQRVLDSVPLLCVDGLVRNSANEVLLVKRKNEPLRNRWWVPGGRVLKGETLERAFRRKMREELGVRVERIRCVGYFEATSLRHSKTALKTGRVHSLSMVFEAHLQDENIVLDSQSSDWRFFEKPPKLFRVQRFAP